MVIEMKMSLNELVDEANKVLESSAYVRGGEDRRVKNKVSLRRVRSYIANGSLHKPFRNGSDIWYDKSHLDKLISLRLLQGQGISEKATSNISTMYQVQSDRLESNLCPEYILPQDLINSSETDGTVDDASRKESLLDFLKTQKVNPAGSTMNIDNLSGRGLVGSSKPLIVGASQQMPDLNNIASGLNASNSIMQPLDRKATSWPKGSVVDLLKGDSLLDYVDDRVGTQAVNNSVNILETALNTVSQSPVKSIQEYQLDEQGKVFLRVEGRANLSNPEGILEKIKQILNIKEN